jgi:hypothetical protein
MIRENNKIPLFVKIILRQGPIFLGAMVPNRVPRGPQSEAATICVLAGTRRQRERAGRPLVSLAFAGAWEWERLEGAAPKR